MFPCVFSNFPMGVWETTLSGCQLGPGSLGSLALFLAPGPAPGVSFVSWDPLALGTSPCWRGPSWAEASQ